MLGFFGCSDGHFGFIPKGCSSIAQRPYLGEPGAGTGLVPKGRLNGVRFQPSFRDSTMPDTADPTLKRWATAEHPSGMKQTGCVLIRGSLTWSN